MKALFMKTAIMLAVCTGFTVAQACDLYANNRSNAPMIASASTSPKVEDKDKKIPTRHDDLLSTSANGAK